MRQIYIILAASLLLTACTMSASDKTPEATAQTVPLATPTVALPTIPPMQTANPPATASFCPGTLPSRLKIGDPAHVDEAQPLPNNVRAAPGQDAELTGQINPGETVTILDGPACRGKLIWWEVEMTDGTRGWTAESDNETYWLEPLDAQPIPSATIAPTATP